MMAMVSGVASTAPWPEPRMVGMAMRDDGARPRLRRVDIGVDGADAQVAVEEGAAMAAL